MACVIGRQISHVLLGKWHGNADHRGMLALPLLVGGQRVADVFCALAGDHGDFVNFGKTGLIPFYAVAADTHGGFGFADIGIAFDFLGNRGSGRASDKKGQYVRQQLVHFAFRMEVCGQALMACGKP